MSIAKAPLKKKEDRFIFFFRCARMEEDFEVSDTPLANFLMLARYSEQGDLDTMKELLREDNSLLNAQDELGRTAMHMACANGHEAVVDWLLKAGAAALPNVEGSTALHHAALNNHLRCAEMLLQSRRWLPNTTNVFGRTAVQEIREKQFEEMELLLLKYDEELDKYVAPSNAEVVGLNEGNEENDTLEDGVDAPAASATHQTAADASPSDAPVPVPVPAPVPKSVVDLPKSTGGSVPTGIASYDDIE